MSFDTGIKFQLNEGSNAMSIMIMDFNALTFDMYDTTGARVGGSDDVTGSMTIDMATGAGTATLASSQLFFGYLWTAHDVTVQMTSDTTATFSMLFDWSTNLDIPVTLDTSITFNDDGTMSFAALDTDGDGIVGTPMASGPFAGFTPAFSGTVYPEEVFNSQPVVSDVNLAGDIVGLDTINTVMTNAYYITNVGERFVATKNNLANVEFDLYRPHSSYTGTFTIQISDGAGFTYTSGVINSMDAADDVSDNTSNWITGRLSVDISVSLNVGTIYTMTFTVVNGQVAIASSQGVDNSDGLGFLYSNSLIDGDSLSLKLTYTNLFPEASDSEVTTFTGSLVTATDLDIADTHTYTLVADSTAVDNTEVTVTDANITVTADGDYTLTGNFETLAVGETATVTFDYIATDNSGAVNAASDAATVTLTVTGTNDAPVANNDTGLVNENASATIDVLANDTDVDGDTLTVTQATATNGTVSVSADGTLDYQGNQDFNGTDIITYTVSDGNGGEDTATVDINDTAPIIQIRNGSMVTKAEASILEYGEDYSGGNTDKLIRYEMWVDASALTELETEIRGYQFDMTLNASEVSAYDFDLIPGSGIGFNASNPENSGIIFNSSIGAVAIASSGAIVDTTVSNDGPPTFIVITASA